MESVNARLLLNEEKLESVDKGPLVQRILKVVISGEEERFPIYTLMSYSHKVQKDKHIASVS